MVSMNLPLCTLWLSHPSTLLQTPTMTVPLLPGCDPSAARLLTARMRRLKLAETLKGIKVWVNWFVGYDSCVTVLGRSCLPGRFAIFHINQLAAVQFLTGCSVCLCLRPNTHTKNNTRCGSALPLLLATCPLGRSGQRATTCSCAFTTFSSTLRCVVILVCLCKSCVWV